MSDHLEDQYQRIKLAIDSLRAASIGNTPTAEEIRAAQKKADSKPDTTVDEVLQEAGFSTKGERQAEVATIKEIKQWAEEILVRVRRNWEGANTEGDPRFDLGDPFISSENEWTTKMAEDVADDIAEYLLAVKGDDRFDPRNPFVSSQTAIRQLTLNTIIAESEFGRAVPGALTFRVRKREITAGMVGQGLITDAERRAIRGETGFPEHNDFALQFNKQMAFQMPEFMNEATGVVRFRGGLGAIPGQGKLSALTQNVIERFSEEDIAAGALPLPKVVTDRYKPDPLKGGRDQITAALTTEDGVFKQSQVKNAVDAALRGQGVQLDRSGYPAGQEGADAFAATIRARDQIVERVKGAAASLQSTGAITDVAALANALADYTISQAARPAFDAEVQSNFTAAQTTKEGEQATKASDKDASDQGSRTALDDVLKQIGKMSRDEISADEQLRLETRIANGDREAVENDLRSESFVRELRARKTDEDLQERRDDESVGNTAFDDALWAAVGPRVSRGDFFEDDLPGLIASFLESGELPIDDMVASRQRQVEAEAAAERETAGITAVKPTEIERTLQNLGVGRVGDKTDYQKYLLDTVVPQVSSALEDIRRRNPTAHLETSSLIPRLLGLEGFRAESPQLAEIPGKREFAGPTQSMPGATQGEVITPPQAFHPFVDVEREINRERAQPLLGIDFISKGDFARAQVQVDPLNVPGQDPRYDAVLEQGGIAPLPTLDNTGVGRDRPPGLDIPENPELLALIAEIAEGDTDFQNYLIGQIPSLIDELGKQAVSERQRREKEAFAKYGFTVDSEGKETAPAGNLLDMSPQQRSRLITTETTPEYRFGPDRGDLPESQQLEPLIRSRRQNLLLDFRNTPTYLARQRRDQERGQELASLETERSRGRALRRGTSRFVSTRV